MNKPFFAETLDTVTLNSRTGQDHKHEGMRFIPNTEDNFHRVPSLHPDFTS